MSSPSSLDDQKKLVVTYRVEGGCLGPEGHNHIVNFCDYAQANIVNGSADFLTLNIVPRLDKTLPEIQFNILSKKVTYAQAEKYLSYFGQNLEDFECLLSDELTKLIREYAGKYLR